MIGISIIALLLISLCVSVSSLKIKNNIETDFDPLVDVEVSFVVEGIRYLEDDEQQVARPKLPLALAKNIGYFPLFKTIFFESDPPSMYVKVFINDVEYVSSEWANTFHVDKPGWTARLNVPDDEEFVDIRVQVWNNKNDKICDISGDTGSDNDAYDAELTYSIKDGHWTGDDSLGDPSGYGRLNGCDDGTIYQKDRDCEIWFNILQNDYDEDGIPYWAEVNDYQTDPEVENVGDPDNDGIPVDWEWKWGYNPFEEDDHENLDDDEDSLNNYEEYLTSAWLSDPFRKDVYVELDIMEDGPNGEKTYFPGKARELIYNAFNRQNIVLHIDMGEMGGYEIIPFVEEVSYFGFYGLYQDYFLHGDKNNWRRGVFHYGVVVHGSEGAAGYMFRYNAFQVSSKGHEKLANENPWYSRNVVYASAYMHELGHTFNFNPIPGHDINADCDEVRPYKSCMSYCWMYKIVDYSDGSREEPDIDDWNRIDYRFFER
jgi:hypothetical protein